MFKMTIFLEIIQVISKEANLTIIGSMAREQISHTIHSEILSEHNSLLKPKHLQ